MSELFFSPGQLDILANKTATDSIEVAGSILRNPNDIDHWIALASKLNGDARTEVYLQALLFAEGLPEDSKSDFIAAITRAIEEDYLSLSDFRAQAAKVQKPEALSTETPPQTEFEAIPESEVTQLVQDLLVLYRNGEYQKIVSEVYAFSKQDHDVRVSFKFVALTGELREDASRIARNSFSGKDGDISLANFYSSDLSPEYTNQVRKEQALVFLEEFLHFLQNQTKTGRLTKQELPKTFPQAPVGELPSSTSEIDVALFLKQSGIDLSDTFFAQRYGRAQYL